MPYASPQKQAEYFAEYRRLNAERNSERMRQWRIANPEKYRQNRRNAEASRRARKRGQFVEVVQGSVLFERDKGTCGICSIPVKLDEYEIDHIIPLSKGGEHSFKNTQIAHRNCNRKKGASL